MVHTVKAEQVKDISTQFHVIFKNIEIQIWSSCCSTKETIAPRPYLIKFLLLALLSKKEKMLFYLIQINTLRRFSPSFREETKLQGTPIQFDFSLINFGNSTVCLNR